MAIPSVTYTFSNGTTADGTQVNQNFTDIINSLTDGTKSLTIDALTVGGTATLNGAVTLGNGSPDDITVTGSLASSVPIKTNNSFNFGSATLGLASVYLGSAGGLTTRVVGGATGSSWTLTLPTTAGTTDYVLKTNGSGVTSWRELKSPTVTTYGSGSGTYTTPASVKYLRVRMVGGGGGGGGSGTVTGSAAGAGGTTTFGSSFLSASGGAAGAWAGAGGSGGGGSLAAGAAGTAIGGGYGSPGAGWTSDAIIVYVSGGNGGPSSWGGAGAGGWVGAAGYAGIAQTGSGGGGGGGSTTVNSVYTGAGGGSGGFVDVVIASPGASYAYSVGAGGTAGGAGTSGYAGGAGGAGYIEITEYYQ